DVFFSAYFSRVSSLFFFFLFTSPTPLSTLFPYTTLFRSARRLQDPLAELIKINPESIGVGQYQHDLPQKQLDSEVEATVETAVNKVGVNLNTASIQLLTYISGLNKTTAQNIILYREENGKFQNRKELKKVPRLGPKAYEQAAGFLRIIDGNESLD